jgi:hypothetical protein
MNSIIKIFTRERPKNQRKRREGSWRKDLILKKITIKITIQGNRSVFSPYQKTDFLGGNFQFLKNKKQKIEF